MPEVCYNAAEDSGPGYPTEQAHTERQPVGLSRADFVGLVDEHVPALYRLAYRMVSDPHDAEDIVQETLRSAWVSRRNYQRNRSCHAWLAAILRRRVIDRWRRERRLPLVVGTFSIEVAVAPIEPFGNDFSDEVSRALSRLPCELRESLLLVVVGERTHQETADALGVPLGTVLSRVSRARQRLRKDLRAAAFRQTQVLTD